MAEYTNFGFMRPGNGDGDEPKKKQPLSENEKIAIAQNEREKMLEYMRHPSYKERLKKEMFGDTYNPAKKRYVKTLEDEYSRRIDEVSKIPIQRGIQEGEGASKTYKSMGQYVPDWYASNIQYSDEPYYGQKGSSIYISEDPSLESLQTNPEYYKQVVGHELGHASHRGELSGAPKNLNFFKAIKELFTQPTRYAKPEHMLYQHSYSPNIESRKAFYEMVEPYYYKLPKTKQEEISNLAQKKMGSERVQMLKSAIENAKNEQRENVKKYGKNYDREKYGPFIPKNVENAIGEKAMFEYLNENPTEVGTRMIGLRKLAAEKFGHNMNEDFDIRKYKDQIQDYFKKNGMIDEYKELSKDLELSDDQINEMMKYIAKAERQPSVSRYTG